MQTNNYNEPSSEKLDITVLAIDPGTKFCGLAICKNHKAFPIKTIQFNNDFQRLKHLLKTEIQRIKPNIIIIGFSRYAKMQHIVQHFYLPIIKEAGLPPKTPVYLLDEKNTTTFANTYAQTTAEQIALNNLTKQKNKGVLSIHSLKNKNKARGIIDKASALILLYKAHEKNIIVCN